MVDTGACMGRDKERVRRWLAQRRRVRAPLPEPAQIREQLGWAVGGDGIRTTEPGAVDDAPEGD